MPFGSLGVHKGSDFKDADPCLFVFDCLLYNGENLMNKPIKERRKFLVDNMVEVGNRIKLSEIKHITKKQQLVDMIKEVLSLGLEGLMIKDTKSIYEPGKRHWMKVVKKPNLAIRVIRLKLTFCIVCVYYSRYTVLDLSVN